jgi:PhzF family phenazine biosynthesis protein
MAQRIVQVDAFTDRPFTGNPAAVCVLAETADDAWMQAVAREMNLSETAFLREEGGGYALRWFTPTTEVDLCGHATLASAHVLWEEGHLAPDAPARFATKSGELTARKDGKWIQMDFPATPVAAVEAPEALIEALGVATRFVGKSRFDYLVEVDTEQAVRTLAPDVGAISRLPARGVIVTARADQPSLDFVSRCFYPAVGVPEDPVTGSAHCALGPHWQMQSGKNEFRAYQASERGGIVRVAVDGDRVLLGGEAVTVLRAEILASSS